MIQDICLNWVGVCMREVSPAKKKKKGNKLNKPKKASSLFGANPVLMSSKYSKWQIPGELDTGE
jgi:hypothetical protein